MRSIICAALSAGIAVAGSSGAVAQRAGDDIYADEPYYQYNYREPYSDEDRTEMPIRPASCGEFRYWDGKQCVDARVVPPDVG